MFATIKSLIPEPRQADQPRHYVGRHRRPEPVPAPVSPAPIVDSPENSAAEPASADAVFPDAVSPDAISSDEKTKEIAA